MTKREKMISEAIERMEMMGVDSGDIERFKENNRIVKVLVNHDAHTLCHDEMTAEEVKMIEEFEANNFVVYYLIQDEALWPDGERFQRYAMLYVDEYENDYEYVKEDAIQDCGTVPAYVVNTDCPDYSEHTEIGFRNVGGLLLNAT